jgi:hypothetical protein
MVYHMSPAEPVLHICADLEEASLEVARKTVELAQTAVATSGQFSIVSAENQVLFAVVYTGQYPVGITLIVEPVGHVEVM